jgi:1,4-alpha-glucan branching enzyme
VPHTWENGECLQIRPVSNLSLTVDWGFLPIGYFGVDERFGSSDGRS